MWMVETHKPKLTEGPFNDTTVKRSNLRLLSSKCKTTGIGRNRGLIQDTDVNKGMGLPIMVQHFESFGTLIIKTPY